MRYKSIMILGAGQGQVPLIKRARESGWRTLVVSPKGNYPGFDLADSCAYIDISDKDAVLECAIEEKVSAIATDQTDLSVPTVLYVAKKLGLPCIQCENIDTFRLKSLMRKVCENTRISFIPYCVSDSMEEVVSFWKDLPGRAAIIKPVDSQGSRGVHRVSSLQEIRSAFDDARRFSKSGHVIIERFIEGCEVEVDTVVKDNEIVCTLIGDVFNFKEENSFSAYMREYPTSLSPIVQESIRTVNAEIISGFGLKTGWTHGEYIVDKENCVYLLEIGARGGGNFIGSDIVREMMGVSTDEMALGTAIGDFSFYDRVYLRGCFCAYRCFYLPEGEVISVDISNNVLDEPFVLTHNLDRIEVGMRIHKNTDKTSRFTLVVKEKSRKALKERIATIEQSIRVLVKNKEGIRGIIWN